MKLKTIVVDGKTYAVLDDKGQPIYVHDDGKEVGYDVPGAVKKIGELNNEARTHREAKEAAELKLKGFEGIEDVEAAKKAIETVANLGAGELKTAAQVEEIKAQAKKAAEEQVLAAKKGLEEANAKLQKDNADLRGGWDNEKIGTAFSNSKYVKEKTLLPSNAAHKIFGDQFKVEEGKIVGYGPDGKQLYSVENPGSIAGFDEALSLMVDKYPDRAEILRAPGGGSGGRQNGAGDNNQNGGKTISRREFDGLQPAARMEKMQQGFQVTDT
jgi:hypothetical protein